MTRESRSDSENRAASEASREDGEDRETRPEGASREASEKRAESEANREPRESRSDSETRTANEASREQGESRSDDDIPLNIAGHEDREPPGGSESATGQRPGASERPDGAKALLGSTDDGDDAQERESASDAADDGTDEDDEVQPVEVLVQLAREDEIEPWDIDIVTVTDKFLDRMDEADLRISGRALFYASVLLRMKSDALLTDDDTDEESEEPWEAAMGQDAPVEPVGDPFASLEAEMDRRLDRKRARGMPQTLDELVRDLREAERDTWWKESREYDTSDAPSSFQRGTQELDYHSADALRMDDEPTEADVTGTAHDEDMDAVINDVYAELLEQWEAGRDEVLYAEIELAGGSRVETFLGLLFLAHRGQVRLQQDDLFGDLWIQDPNANTASGEAVAD